MLRLLRGPVTLAHSQPPPHPGLAPPRGKTLQEMGEGKDGEVGDSGPEYSRCGISESQFLFYELYALG